MTILRAPLAAQLVQWLVEPGAVVHQGEVVAVLEAMKMEHELRAPATVRVRELLHA
ncbi:MAG: acetyl-CoA carboxylase biotin carboxyl carrier protein subunit, partial [Ramlibacter sp.]